MKNISIVCTPGFPMSRGTGASMVTEAFLVNPFRHGGAIKPVQRQRISAAAGIVLLPPVQTQVQTTDPTFVPSVLSCERRT